MEDKELEEFYMTRLRRILGTQYRMIIDNRQLSDKTKLRQAELIENIMGCVKEYEEKYLGGLEI